MGKVIKLTETELKNIIEKVLTEQQQNNVTKIQTALKPKYGNLLGTSGPNGDGVDGIYGTRTRQAVMQFQKDNGIKPTGYVGKITAPLLGVQPMGSADYKKPDFLKNAAMGTQTPAASDNTRVAKTSVPKQITGQAQTQDTVISKNVNPEILKQIDPKKINSRDSVLMMKANQPECAKFVHDFSSKIKNVGNAWIAHDNSSVGTTVWDAFSNLKPDTVKRITTLWDKIEKAGGGKENGQFNAEVKGLVNSIVPKTPPVQLKIDDVVGLFYPPSGHHEEAFMSGSKYGKGYFVKNSQGQDVPGNTLSRGQAWGMNTHVGIVGAMKNGVPIIFHNVHGTVFADPPNKMYNGARVAWVKRMG